MLFCYFCVKSCSFNKNAQMVFSLYPHTVLRLCSLIFLSLMMAYTTTHLKGKVEVIQTWSLCV